MTTKKVEKTEQMSLFNGYTPALPDKSDLQEVFKRIAEFQEKMFEKPDKNFIDKTPNGKAETIVISYVETKLDELYSGLWSVTNFEWKQVANELAGSLILKVFHPECGVWIERVGCAAIQIMVDKAPDGVNKNEWALNLANKKSNALYMGFGKLKAECLKNAAKSLGVTFGRDLNRKKADSDFNHESFEKDINELKAKITDLLISAKISEKEVIQINEFLTDPTTTHLRLKLIIKRLNKCQ